MAATAISTLLQSAFEDDAFRQQLLTQPAQAAAQLGVTLRDEQLRQLALAGSAYEPRRPWVAELLAIAITGVPLGKKKGKKKEAKPKPKADFSAPSFLLNPLA